MKLRAEFEVWDRESQTFLTSSRQLEVYLSPMMFSSAGGIVSLETPHYQRVFSMIKALWASVNTFHRTFGGKYLLVASYLEMIMDVRKLEPLETFGAVIYRYSLILPTRLYTKPEVLRALCRAIVVLKSGEPIPERDREILSNTKAEDPPFIRTEECGYPLVVEFEDEWNSINKEMFLSLLQGLETPKPIRVILYGLREDKGDVWAIPTAPKKYRLKGDFPKPAKEGNTIYIGVPYSFRKENIDIAFLKEVLSWIRQSLSSVEGKSLKGVISWIRKTLSSYVGGQQ